MKTISALCLAAVILVTPSSQRGAGGFDDVAVHANDESIVVSADWVNERLGDPRLVLLDVGPDSAYAEGHLPGAVLVRGGLWQNFSATYGERHLELPAPTDLQAAVRAVGINQDSWVVIHTATEWMTPSSRLFFDLEHAGLRGQVFILAGGRPAWVEAGYPLSDEVPEIVTGNFTVAIDSSIVATSAWVLDHLDDESVSIWDARGDDGYFGRNRGEGRKGHIPGAINLSWSNLITQEPPYQPLARSELRAIFREAGVAEGNTVVSYCWVGQIATWVYFSARYLGYDARVYDGSWQEWSANESFPIETGE